ncbi:MAG: hypothetical protein LBV68_07470 [Spirochaetaceae bacterium]|nr:hypothetical protein [Spirochaetaceae bacterium]
MNIIPTTFNDKNKKRLAASLIENPVPAYTVVGGNEHRGSSGVSAILLNRGVRYPRRSLFYELGKAGFDYVVSVEGPNEHYDLDELSRLFPFVRFILLSETVNIGEQINIAVSEIKSPLFFVLWNDLKILYGGTAAKIAERIVLPPEKVVHDNEKKRWYKRLCTIPVFQNPEFETLPTASGPLMIKKKFEIARFSPGKEDMPSLYPYDAVGIYDRERFLDLGGFDTEIKSEHWQLLDFGFRAWLWGEQIRCTQLIRLRYEGFKKIEDTTYDESYWHFFLKNLSPVLRCNTDTKELYAHLPLKNFFTFLFKAGQGPLNAAHYFLNARHWVYEHRLNWKTSAKALTQEWKARE